MEDTKTAKRKRGEERKMAEDRRAQDMKIE